MLTIHSLGLGELIAQFRISFKSFQSSPYFHMIYCFTRQVVSVLSEDVVLDMLEIVRFILTLFFFSVLFCHCVSNPIYS